MTLLSKEEQFKLFCEVAYQVSHEPIERKRFDLLSNVFRSLNLGPDFRWRIGQLTEEGKVIAIKYGFGNYGAFDITQLRYRVDASIRDRLFQKDESIFSITAKAKSGSVDESLKLNSPAISYIQMTLFKNGNSVGIATFDSSGVNLFSRDLSEALDPYKHLMVLALDSAPSEQQDDVISFVSRTKRKQVVVLGKDSGPEIQRLTWISRILRELEYQPVLVKETPDIPELSNEEKVRVFIDTSRFVVVENSFPAGEIAELKMCATNRATAACLRESGKGSSWMVGDYSIDFNFIKEFEYDGSFESLRESIQIATQWAESKLVERANFFRTTYPWRAKEIEIGIT